MGKGQSKPEVAFVESIPVAYDLDRATTRPLSPEHRVIVVHQSTEQLDTLRPQRSQSVYSLPDRTMASKWKSAQSRRDILDRKAYYLGRFQAKAITEANLIELRRTLLKAKRRKTRIKMSPLGFSFGTKPGGLLNTDKVPYQFVPLEDIETLRLDGVMREVLLCIFRIDHNRSNVQNSNFDSPIVQHYEINAFHMDPRDGVLFQRAQSDFHVKGPLYQQMSNGEATLKGRSMSHGHITDDDDGWRVVRTNNNTLIASPSKSDQNRKRHQSNSETYRHAASPDYTDSTSSFVYSGTNIGHPSNGYQYQSKSYTIATEPRFPADSNSILTHTSGNSITRRVYYNGDIPMADVETQVTPEASTEGTSRSTYDTSENFRGRSSSYSSQKSGYAKKDSVKRRLRDLSREMDQLKTLIDQSEDNNMSVMNGDILEESSASSGSTIHTGLATRINQSHSMINQQDHAGTIDTMMGKVDVVVDTAPVYNHHGYATNRRSYQDGYMSESQTVTHKQNRPVRRHISNHSHTDSEIGGRYVYYRPVLQEPQPTYRREQVRPRSVEPQSRGKKGWFR